MDIEKIRAFYNPELKKGNDAIYVLHRGDEKIHLGFNRDREIILTLDKCKFVTTSSELGKALFPEHWEKMKHKWTPDERTLSYLKAVKENIGLLETLAGVEGLITGVAEEYPQISIGEDKDGRWVAECITPYFDDYTTVTYVFRNRPSAEAIKTAILIGTIGINFTLSGWDKAVFTCWECGQKVHWLDIPGKLPEKWQLFKDDYCGC